MLRRKQIMQTLFFLLYLLGLLSAYLSQMYTSQIPPFRFMQSYFYLILTIIKIIVSALSGFIIDHVQYSLNILLISQSLMLLSCIFYLANLFAKITQNLYFAVSFQILGDELLTIMILTLISKHFPPEDIPRQVGIYYQFGCFGRIICFLFGYISSYQYAQYYLAPFTFVILFFLIFFVSYSFRLLRKDAYQIIKELNLEIISDKTGLMPAIKNQINHKKILVVIAASSILSIVSVCQQSSLATFYLKHSSAIIYFNWPQMLLIVSGFLGIISTQLAMGFAFYIYSDIKKSAYQEKKMIKYIQIASLGSIFSFLVSLITDLYSGRSSEWKICFYILIMIFQEYNFTAIYISSAGLIGIQQDNFRTQGLSFGVLSMFIAIFTIGVIIGTSQIPDLESNSIQYNPQSMQILINFFGLIQSIIGQIFSRIFKPQTLSQY